MAAPPIAERHLPHFHRRAPMKEAVRVATTANITISTALNNGDTLDGVTLATGDRVLVKDQSTGSQNGIYEVGASPARAYDESTDDPSFGWLVYVRQGTTNGGTLWVNTNTSTPTIGSTALTFSEFTGGGGGASLPWSYAQADGGLAGDGSTDDTSAFQAWITSVTASGTRSGWFFFEPGTYLIGGALQDTGAFNGQILLPNVSTSSEQITLTFSSAARPPYAWHGTTAPVSEGYAVIKSTLTGASGTAAVISAGNGTPPAQNNISVVIENLIFLGPDNPTFTFLNLKNVQGGAIRSVQIATAGGFSGSPVQPTHSNSYGIKLPQVYNSNYTYVDGISVGAYYTGVLQGELSIIRGLVLGVCIVGIELPTSIHASLIVDMHQSGCPTGIKVTGLHYCDILQYDAEHYVGNVTPFPSWMNPIYDLDDGSNNGFGAIRFLLIDNDGSGPSGWSVDHTFVKNGGTGFSAAEIGPLSSSPSGSAGGDLSGTYPNPTVAKINGSPLGTISGPATADRLRWNGSAWVNSALIWRPVTTYDPTSGLWVPLVDGDGNAIMAEA